MAPKRDIHEKCESCGETVARLVKDGIAWNPSACKCPKPPGPQAPPRTLSLHSANFIPANQKPPGMLTAEELLLAGIAACEGGPGPCKCIEKIKEYRRQQWRAALLGVWSESLEWDGADMIAQDPGELAHFIESYAPDAAADQTRPFLPPGCHQIQEPDRGDRAKDQ